MKEFNILIATGGTGGHIFPALSCGEFFENNGKSVNYILSGSKIGKIEKTNVIYMESYHFDKNPIQFAKALWFLKLNTVKSLFILRRNKPCVILATGSYAVVPIILASILLRIPFYLMEQNVIPGLVNKIFSRLSKATFVAFEETRKYLKGKVIVVGLPIREKAKKKYSKEEARRILNLPEDKVTILVIGGSLGARGMVEKIIPAINKLNDYYFIIQAGARNFNYINSLVQNLNLKNCIVLPFIEEIGLYYSAADMVISRAGASSCMEILYHGKPSILVPYPYSRDRHQYYNASELVKTGKAIVIEEQEIQEKLENCLKDITWISEKKSTKRSLIENSEELIYTEIFKDAVC